MDNSSNLTMASPPLSLPTEKGSEGAIAILGAIVFLVISVAGVLGYVAVQKGELPFNLGRKAQSCYPIGSPCMQSSNCCSNNCQGLVCIGSPPPTSTPIPCRNIGDSCSGNNNCCSNYCYQNICRNPSEPTNIPAPSTSVPAPTNVCAPFIQKTCSGSQLKTCNSNGTGWDSVNCQYGCANNSCLSAPPPTSTPKPTSPPVPTNVCAPGITKVCNGSQLKTCNLTGTGWDLTTCPYGCANGACNPTPQSTSAPAPTNVCAPTIKTCSGNQLKTCNLSGTGWDIQTCPYGCANNACKTAPPPTSTSAPTQIACQNIGYSCSVNSNCCSNYCYNSMCNSPSVPTSRPTARPTNVCAPFMEKICSGTQLKTCNSNGTGWDVQTCPYGCANSACLPAPQPTPVCDAGTKTCTNGRLKTCRSDGSAWDNFNCPYGCANSSGCNLPSQPTDLACLGKSSGGCCGGGSSVCTTNAAGGLVCKTCELGYFCSAGQGCKQELALTTLGPTTPGTEITNTNPLGPNTVSVPASFLPIMPVPTDEEIAREAEWQKTEEMLTTSGLYIAGGIVGGVLIIAAAPVALPVLATAALAAGPVIAQVGQVMMKASIAPLVIGLVGQLSVQGYRTYTGDTNNDTINRIDIATETFGNFGAGLGSGGAVVNFLGQIAYQTSFDYLYQKRLAELKNYLNPAVESLKAGDYPSVQKQLEDVVLAKKVGIGINSQEEMVYYENISRLKSETLEQYNSRVFSYMAENSMFNSENGSLVGKGSPIGTIVGMRNVYFTDKSQVFNYDQNKALVLVEETLHAYQSYTGGLLATTPELAKAMGKIDLYFLPVEIDVALFFRSQGIEMTPEFMRAHSRQEIFNALGIGY